MKKNNIVIGALVLLVSVFILNSCSTQQNVWGSKKALRFDGIPPVNYQLISTFRQTMTVMDQPMEITSEEMLRFVVDPVTETETGQKLNFTIDEMTAKIETPRGDMEEDLSELSGKEFTMDLSAKGAEGSLFEAKMITYQSTTGQEMNLASRFQAFFPNLPDGPITMNEAWDTRDSVVEATSAGSLKMVFEGSNRIIGFEKWNEVDCVKILTVYTGTISGTAQEQGMNLVTAGTLSGNETWYFAYKEGYYVKGVNEGTMEGAVTASGAQEMVIPLKREYRMVVSDF